MINNFSSVGLIRYGFDSNGLLMTQNIRIVLHVLLAMFGNPMKLWEKVAGSKPKGISD